MIKVENLKKSFGRLEVLSGIDLEIQKGESVVVIGQSGCGKSVLLKHIIALLRGYANATIASLAGQPDRKGSEQ